MELNWLYRRLGDDFGPVALETLHELRQSGQLDDDDLIRRTSENEWRPASTLPAFDKGTDFDLDVSNLLASAETASAHHLRNQETHRDSLASCGRRNFAPGAKVAVQDVSSWYYKSLGQVLGPFTFDVLKEMAQNGSLDSSDDVREGEEGVWLSAKRLPELFPKKAGSGLSSAEIDVVEEERPEWVCRIDGAERGPMTLGELKKLAKSGELDRKDMVRRSWGAAWVHAQDVANLKFPEPVRQTLAAAPTPAPTSAPVDRKSDPLRDALPPSKESAEMAAAAIARPRPTPPASTPSYSAPPAYTPPAPAYTPPPAYRPPVAPPPPPMRSRSSSGPSWSFSLPSGMFDQLKNPKLLGGVGAVVLVVALLFVPGLLGKSPGSREFAQVQEIWSEVDNAIKSNAPDATFKAISDKHLAEVKTLRKQIEPRASAQNRLAQIVLYCTRDHLPKILTGAEGERKKQYERMKADIQEASELFQRLNG